MGHGIELSQLPLDRFCNFVWWAVTKDGDPVQVTKFRAKLWMPPPKTEVTDKRSPWSAENETKAFTALKAQLGNPTLAGS